MEVLHQEVGRKSPFSNARRDLAAEDGLTKDRLAKDRLAKYVSWKGAREE